MIEKFIPFVIALGMLLDIASCMAFIRRNRQGKGPSGQPLVTLVLLYWLPLLIFGHPVLTHSVWLDGLCLWLFHLLMLFIIPAAHKHLTTPKT